MLLLAMASLGAFAPAAYTADEGVRLSEAKCATCCPEEGSTCIVGDKAASGYYYKASGSCTPPPPPDN